MNKTVRDAVIYYGGSNFVIGKHEQHHTHIVCGSVSGGFFSVYASDVSGSTSVICTIKAYNTYVDSLSHHAGKELFQQYLAADKTLLEKEVKVDYTSEELWKDAPEGFDLYMADSDCWYESFFKVSNGMTCSEYRLSDGFERACFDYSVDTMLENGAIKRPVPRPQPKPVFTQEMSDNGGMVEAGMRFATEAGEYTAEYTNKKSVCFTDEDGFLVTVTRGHAKPLTPPIELIDGKAYQFEAEGKVISGCYNKLNTLLYSAYKEYLPHLCTNIKPLTVEVR